MTDQTKLCIYEIRIKESLTDNHWGWFESMRLAIQPDGNTLLTGPVIDQSALVGLLNQVSALGLTLISVNMTGQGS